VTSTFLITKKDLIDFRWFDVVFFSQESMKGGEKVNKKIFIMSMTLIALTMLVAPVMAEPLKAEVKNDNPDAEILDGFLYSSSFPPIPIQELTQILPSGVIHNWVYFPGEVTIHTKVLPRDKFYKPTTLDVGANFGDWLANTDYLGKWVKMSKAGYVGLHLAFGFVDYPFDLIPDEGVYIMGMYA
jgi:hypothetical protein